jgi:nucleotide-binding universal stress UspA family protein
MRILLGYDGSKNAKAALARATELTKNSDGELVVVVAANVPIPAPYANRSYYEQLHNDVVEHARSLVAEASDMARQAGVTRVTGSVKEGFPADVIASHAAEMGADMIVVGRRGIRGVERTLIGSVSSSVLAQSKCDVLVVMG